MHDLQVRDVLPGTGNPVHGSSFESVENLAHRAVSDRHKAAVTLAVSQPS
jgi:hypothetical protein